MNIRQVLSGKERASLSALGLNTSALWKPIFNGKPPTVIDVINILELFITEIETEQEYIYYEICDCYFFKKSTLLKGLYTSNPNVYPELLIKTMQNKEKRDALLQRLYSMRTILTTAL